MHLKRLFSVLSIVLCLCVLCGCGKEKKRDEVRVYLSPKAMAAKYYIDNELPEEQRQAFYTGMGDGANLLANLMKSGHLEGAAEYQKAIEKLNGDD